MGGADEADVDAAPRLRADATHLPGLEDAEEATLEREGQLADLVEEQGAGVRLLEEPPPRPRRPGERALLVTEELALDQRRGHAARVHRHEGPAPPALGVQRPGDPLLADAALAVDEHRPVEGGEAPHVGVDVAQGLGGDDHLGRREVFTPQLEVRPTDADPTADREADQADRHAVEEGAVEALEIAELHRAAAGLQAAVVCAHRGIAQHEIVLRGGADGDRALPQGDPPRLAAPPDAEHEASRERRVGREGLRDPTALDGEAPQPVVAAEGQGVGAPDHALAAAGQLPEEHRTLPARQQPVPLPDRRVGHRDVAERVTPHLEGAGADAHLADRPVLPEQL
jgi:hypothetical protein